MDAAIGGLHLEIAGPLSRAPLKPGDRHRCGDAARTKERPDCAREEIGPDVRAGDEANLLGGLISRGLHHADRGDLIGETDEGEGSFERFELRPAIEHRSHRVDALRRRVDLFRGARDHGAGALGIVGVLAKSHHAIDASTLEEVRHRARDHAAGCAAATDRRIARMTDVVGTHGAEERVRGTLGDLSPQLRGGGATPGARVPREGEGGRVTLGEWLLRDGERTVRAFLHRDSRSESGAESAVRAESRVDDLFAQAIPVLHRLYPL